MRKSKLLAALAGMLALLFTAVSCSDGSGEEGGNDTTAPAFTSFTIPSAGISKKDSTVTATVKGKNFTASGVASSSFTVTCRDNPSITSGVAVTVQDDSTLKITLKIPDTAGVYALTLAIGKTSKKGTFTVKDYSDYTAGKIVLADGTLVDSSSYTAIDTSNPPVAVVAGFNDYGVALGVGLHTSSSSLKWAESKAAGYKTEFTGTVCTPSSIGSVAATATFTGDTDGSDNWDVICSVDPDGSADAATNYPAFNWANTYGETYKDYLGTATDGWYMPSLAELCYVYRTRGKINTALRVINGIDSSYAQSSIETSNFWSSSQYLHSSYFNYAWAVDFYGSVSYGNKSYGNYVLVVRPVDSGGGESGTAASYPVRNITSEVTSSSVVINWEKPSDTSNYGGVKITWEGGSDVVDSDTTTYTVTGLSASTGYTFKITTLDSTGNETDKSVSVTKTTLAAQTGDTTVGKVVLADGTLVEPSSYTAIDSANPPVAVVAYEIDGKSYGVGLHTSSKGLQWAASNTTGYKTEFTGTVCTPSSIGSVANRATFTGDTDGSDNWSVICSVDPDGTADAATNYPAFNWANTYGATYKDYLGSATDGWYMPSLAELCYVYRNCAAINAALAVISKLDTGYAQSSLGISWFWSSSQYSGNANYAWYVAINNADVRYYPKSDNTTYCVLVVRAF